MMLAVLLLVIAGDVVSDAIDEDGNDWAPERQLQLARVEAAVIGIEEVVTPPEQRPGQSDVAPPRVRYGLTEIRWRSAFIPGVDPPPVNLI